jgi:hypothetical protein
VTQLAGWQPSGVPSSVGRLARIYGLILSALQMAAFEPEAAE